MAMNNTAFSQNADDPFAFLYPHQFMLLTTFRRDGRAMPTTVWFAPDGQGKIYVTTGSSAGKLKRIRNNGRVLMKPSDRVGNPVDDLSVIEAQAREVPAAEHETARAALSRKYGQQFDSIAAQSAGRTYIEIEPIQE